LLLALITIVLCALPGSAAPLTEEELQKEMERIEDRIRAQEDNLAALRKQQASQEKLLPALENEIDAVEAKAAVIGREIERLNTVVEGLNSSIKALNDEIGECERQIDIVSAETEAKDAEIKEMQRRLKERLKEQYMAGPVSNLQLLLSSPDLSSLMTVTEYINRQAQEDDRLKSGLEEEMARMKVLQEQLVAEQLVYEGKKLDLQKEGAKKAEELLKQKKEKDKLDTEHERISKSKSEIYSIIDGLQRETKDVRRIIDKEQRALDEAEARLDALVASKLLSGEIKDVQNDGKMIWPFPYRGCYVTSNFGAFESFRTKPHRGLDISIADKSKSYAIVAALDGTIADFGYHSSMGYYVVIHHGYYAPTGKRIKTTYMHFKANSFDPAVKMNAVVKAGKVIGIMGSTGNSTGPHLHFQVDEYAADGKSSTAVDPLKYVKNPYK